MCAVPELVHTVVAIAPCAIVAHVAFPVAAVSKGAAYLAENTRLEAIRRIIICDHLSCLRGRSYRKLLRTLIPMTDKNVGKLISLCMRHLGR